ncbi:RDD family protein [Alteromonas sp. H39]|uniref:RDD family protein n=1 Tax=Alteromonas sp. H39 TaxID=3389876 RepID=UPI0039E14EF0
MISGQVPDYSNYNDETLQERAATINRSLFPERAAVLDQELARRVALHQPELASRGERFAGAVIDMVIALISLIPLVIIAGDTMQQEPLTGMLMAIGWSVAVIIVVHGYTLINYSQTVGKYFLNTRIEDMDGKPSTFFNILAARFMPITVLTMIPLVGSVIYLVDIFMIFRADKRCMHDLIAGTRVCRLPDAERVNH